MATTRPDDGLLAAIGLPAPPHRLAGSIPLGRRIAGHVAAWLLHLTGAAILVMYVGFHEPGRALFVDTALTLGLGRPIPEARIVPGRCEVYHASGRHGTGGWFCTMTVIDGARRTELKIDTRSRPDLTALHGAGRVLGATGIYWHSSVLLQRWWSDLMLLMLGLTLLLGPLTARGAMRQSARLARLERGHLHTVELLTWSGPKSFAFTDDAGTRRFGRADFPAGALLLDGVATTGVALVAGRDAVLLDEHLAPLQLDPAQHAGILARVVEVRTNGLHRAALRPLPGDAATLTGRIDAIEAALAQSPAAASLPTLYDACWRLVWDSTDAAISLRALQARDTIATRMGPAATDAALRATRERAAGLVV